ERRRRSRRQRAVQGHRRRHPVLFRALLRCPTVGGRFRGSADVGHPPRTVPRRGGGRPAVGHPVPPGEERGRRRRITVQLGRGAKLTSVNPSSSKPSALIL